MNVRLRPTGARCLVVELVGDIDVAVSSEVEALVPLVMTGDPTQVDIDLRSVAFIDLGGLRAVGCLADQLRGHGISCVELAASSAVTRLRELVARLEVQP